jgi:cleavage and polyadenylation specificity factor subunit 1
VVVGPIQTTWKFLCVDSIPILGSDFLAAHSLLIDCRSRRLLSSTSVTTPEIPVSRYHPNQKAQTVSSSMSTTVPGDNGLLPLLDNFSEVFSEDLTIASRSHPVMHQIHTDDRIVTSRPYRLPLGRLPEVRKIFDELLAKGIVTPSDSPYSSPLVLVTKKDGSLRPCVDYTRLNAITVGDQYPLPRIEDIIHSAKGQVFSTLDLRSGYHQIPMEPDDAQKTAVITPFGLFHFLRMPFGLKNAASTFQRFLDHVTRGLPGVWVYVDDILVCGDSLEEHNSRLQSLLDRLRSFNLRVNRAKCSFAQRQVSYLGYVISPEGYVPNPDRVAALQAFATPVDISQLRRFLGMANFYRLHVPHFSRLASPLFAVKEPFQWSPEADRAFRSLKAALSAVAILQLPDPMQPFHVYTDASNEAIGATILQNGRPLAFYSSRLSPTEQRYSTFDREALSVVKTMHSYRHWFVGGQVILHVDHKPLLGFTTMKDPSPRQTRWITSLSEMNITWTYEPGCSNVAADCLSRPARPTTATVQLDSAFPPEWLRTLQSYDVFSGEEDLKSLQPVQFASVWFDLSKEERRLIVPPNLRKDCFDLAHKIAHLGKKKTYLTISSRFVWPSMRADITRWCTECTICQSVKAAPGFQRTPLPFLVSERFHTLHVDIVGPLPSSSTGKQYLLTMLDHFTRWIEAIPITNISAETCAEKLVEHWISRYGVPVKIVSDQGTQFESRLFSSLLSRLGIEHHRTTAYHPQSNGAVERAHRTLKQCLRALTQEGTCWEKSLPMVLFAMRTSVSEATQFPPSHLVFGGGIRAPYDLLIPVPNESRSEIDFSRILMDRLKSILKEANLNQPTRDEAPVPTVTKWVWLKVPPNLKSGLRPPYMGPFQVLQQNGPVVTINKSGKSERVSIDRLKSADVGGLIIPHTTDDNPSQTTPDLHLPPAGNSYPTESPAPVQPLPTPGDPGPGTSSSPVQPSPTPGDPGTSSSSAQRPPTPGDPGITSSRYGRRIPFRFKAPRYVYFRRTPH